MSRLFDYLVVSQAVPVNPASSVKGPKHVVKKDKTPVLSALYQNFIPEQDAVTLS